MDAIQETKNELEQLIGLSSSEADMFWSLSRKCSALAIAPAVAAGATWGPGLAGGGTVLIPGVGTVSGLTATLIIMGAAGGAAYFGCMSLLPQLIEFRDELRKDSFACRKIQDEVRALIKFA